jgi:hypothetical protein
VVVQLATQRRGERKHPFGAPEEFVGYRVCDPFDKEVGIVEKLFVNGGGEPEYVRVKIGLFGLKSVLLPVQMVAVDDERRTLVLR